MSVHQHPEPQISTKNDPKLLARMLRKGNRYSPRRFAIVETMPPLSCNHCGTSGPGDGDVLVTGFQLLNGKTILLDEDHEEIGTYTSPEEALHSYVQTIDELGELEILWLDETVSPTARA